MTDQSPIKKSELTRQRVLSVTSDLFHKNGYDATSMRDIAKATGIKSGSLYYYYESKEALLAAILSKSIAATMLKLEKAVAKLPEGASVRDKFAAAVKTSMKVVIEAGDMALASDRTLSLIQEPQYSEQVKLRESYNQFWRNLIIEGKRTGEIREAVSDALASMWIVGAIAFVPEWFTKGRSTTDAMAETFTDLFFKGLHTPSMPEIPQTASDAKRGTQHPPRRR